jgi:hypothetical protein
MLIDKTSFFAQCLENGSVAEVYVQQVPGLDIPATVTLPAKLEYGWSMPIRIPDLTWSTVGITATLSFDQTPYKTFVPWAAVIAMAPKGQGLVVAWDFCVPASVQEEVTLLPSAPSTSQSQFKKASVLSLVKERP